MADSAKGTTLLTTYDLSQIGNLARKLEQADIPHNINSEQKDAKNKKRVKYALVVPEAYEKEATEALFGEGSFTEVTDDPATIKRKKNTRLRLLWGIGLSLVGLLILFGVAGLSPDLQPFIFLVVVIGILLTRNGVLRIRKDAKARKS